MKIATNILERTRQDLRWVPVSELKPYRGNARRHSKKQIEAIARSIDRFGFTAPVLVDESNRLLAGHGRVEAAKLLGLETVPTVRIEHLSEDEKRAYVIADNRPSQSAPAGTRGDAGDRARGADRLRLPGGAHRLRGAGGGDHYRRARQRAWR